MLYQHQVKVVKAHFRHICKRAANQALIIKLNVFSHLDFDPGQSVVVTQAAKRFNQKGGYFIRAVDRIGKDHGFFPAKNPGGQIVSGLAVGAYKGHIIPWLPKTGTGQLSAGQGGIDL